MFKILEDPVVRLPGDFDKDSEPLSLDNLAFLGFLDDFYDLYIRLQEYNDLVFKEAEQDNGYPDCAYYQRMDNSVIEDLTHPFFEKYSYLFMDPPYAITPKYDHDDPVVNFRLYRLENNYGSPGVKMV